MLYLIFNCPVTKIHINPSQTLNHWYFLHQNKDSDPPSRQNYSNRNTSIKEPNTKTKPLDPNDDIDDNIVVSRGGEFQLMGQRDMIDSSDRRIKRNDDIIGNGNANHKTRPISAPASKRNRNELWSNSKLDSSNSSLRSDASYRTKPIDRNKSTLEYAKWS